MLARVADNSLVRAALCRPVAVLMALLAAFVFGAIALVRVPFELIPSGLSAPLLSINVSYPDVDARDIESGVTRPLEAAVATAAGIQQIVSTSSAGAARITLTFAGDTDMDVAYRQVRDRIERVRSELPADVRSIRIRKESGDSLPVALYAISWDPALADPMGVIERHLLRPIERIDGVGRVDSRGRKDPQVWIDVDRQLAEAAGISLIGLADTLAGMEFTLASGKLHDAGRTLALRSVASLRTPEQIAAIPVREDGLRLRDIATVVSGPPAATRHDRYNGRPAAVMFVIKESQANTIEICDRLAETLAAAAANPETQGIAITPVFVQGDMIRASLEQVVVSGVQGGLLALAVLLFFLRRVRITLLVALSIPMSLFVAIPVMYFTGQSINMVSLVGLMICVGLVVDNSVVVVENIARHRRRGIPPYAAALHGSGEIALATTLATLTTVIVFLPASLLSNGPTQFLMVRLITPVCVSLTASLGVALVVVPLSSTLLLVEERAADASLGRWKWLHRVDLLWKAIVGRAYEATIGWVNEAYARSLRRLLHQRMNVVLTTLFALLSIGLPVSKVRCSAGDQMGARRLLVSYAMPQETTLAQADEFFREVERTLDELADAHGVSGHHVGFDEDTGQVQVFFAEAKPGAPAFEQSARELFEALPSRPGWTKTSQFGASDGARDDSLRISLFGNDHARLARARQELVDRLLAVDGVLGVRGPGDSQLRDELALRTNPAMSERFGVPADVLAHTVAAAIRGAPLPNLRSEERELQVRLRYRENDRRDIDQLLQWSVPTREGGDVPIAAVVSKTISPGEATLRRVDQRVGTEIRLELRKRDRAAVVARVDRVLADHRLPEGFSFESDSDRKVLADMAGDLLGAMGLGTIFMLLAMGFLFESFVLPLAVLPAIPLSLVGVWWFLYATGQSIDALAGIGIVLLLGIVVNNGIVLVDFIRTARAQGLAREDAIVQAARLRFRPIMMTSLTTIGGLLPMAVTTPSGEGIAYQGFGRALLGGMTAATILTLVVVPVTYCYLDDFRDATRAWGRRIRALARHR